MRKGNAEGQRRSIPKQCAVVLSMTLVQVFAVPSCERVLACQYAYHRLQNNSEVSSSSGAKSKAITSANVRMTRQRTHQRL